MYLIPGGGEWYTDNHQDTLEAPNLPKLPRLPFAFNFFKIKLNLRYPSTVYQHVCSFERKLQELSRGGIYYLLHTPLGEMWLQRYLLPCD